MKSRLYRRVCCDHDLCLETVLFMRARSFMNCSVRSCEGSVSNTDLDGEQDALKLRMGLWKESKPLNCRRYLDCVVWKFQMWAMSEVIWYPDHMMWANEIIVRIVEVLMMENSLRGKRIPCGWCAGRRISRCTPCNLCQQASDKLHRSGNVPYHFFCDLSQYIQPGQWHLQGASSIISELVILVAAVQSIM